MLRVWAVVCIVLVSMNACESDFSYSGGDGSLAFAADTLSFDTIFTDRATPTARVWLFNRSGKNMTVGQIRLVGGERSPFNVSINGENSTSITNARMPKGDSLLIYVNVKIASNSDPMPYMVSDAIEAVSGNGSAQIVLVAYGQNVVRIPDGSIADLAWTNNMPYLVEGNAEIDSLETLTIEKGARIYMADGAALTVRGTLLAQGTTEEPITISAANTDAFYSDISGQWKGIRFAAGSRGNQITHTEISNAQTAIMADSASCVTVMNCTVRDASRCAIEAYGATVDIANSILYDCGGALVQACGGQTTVLHSTLSNHYHWQMRRQQAVVVSGDKIYPPLVGFDLVNSIVTGYLADEVLADSVAENQLSVRYSMVKLSKKQQKKDAAHYHNVLFESDPKFVDQEHFDFRLSEKSLAIDSADIEAARLVPHDYFGNTRTLDLGPDMGAIEYRPQDEEL